VSLRLVALCPRLRRQVPTPTPCYRRSREETIVVQPEAAAQMPAVLQDRPLLPEAALPCDPLAEAEATLAVAGGQYREASTRLQEAQRAFFEARQQVRRQRLTRKPS
jgi:hypothetical protein